jgi:hypothetical protein
MATSQNGDSVAPLHISWGVGLLSLMSVVFISVFLPAVVVFLLGGSPGDGAAAMVGGFTAGWVRVSGDYADWCASWLVGIVIACLVSIQF